MSEAAPIKAVAPPPKKIYRERCFRISFNGLLNALDGVSAQEVRKRGEKGRGQCEQDKKDDKMT